MAEQTLRDDRAEDESEAEAAGVTFVLTEQGWEASEFVDPGSDWCVQDDGSCLAADGRVRTWLPGRPEQSWLAFPG